MLWTLKPFKTIKCSALGIACSLDAFYTDTHRRALIVLKSSEAIRIFQHTLSPPSFPTCLLTFFPPPCIFFLPTLSTSPTHSESITFEPSLARKFGNGGLLLSVNLGHLTHLRFIPLEPPPNSRRPDSVMAVYFFRERDPANFGLFSLSFVTMFRCTEMFISL